ncbi:9872_t:CDS:2 [Cetraspora pellucida]|uniref:9872_t:CDS:1 n=1 Tax=Cetraspora pellucida TaxID=1433469 RepID=A0ACA9LRK4_9GLOM|nr:9872_t:CDS:2 [Cetraspora pellucida]
MPHYPGYFVRPAPANYRPLKLEEIQAEDVKKFEQKIKLVGSLPSEQLLEAYRNLKDYYREKENLIKEKLTRGSHNLLEDCQILADFANSIANINNDIQEMTLAVNEQEFNNRKQQLVSKLQGCLSKCQTTSATSIGEILQLEVEIKAAEAKYNDAMTKAATETDPAKKAQLIAIAQTAEREIKQAKQKLARNPLSKLAEYNHLHNLGNLITGNLPQNPTTPLNCPDPDDSDPNNSNSGRNSGGRNRGSGQTS